jgi:hypothetical protein
MSYSSPRPRKRGGCAASLVNIITAFIVVTAVFLFLGFLLLAFSPQLVPANMRHLVPVLAEREAAVPPTLIPVAEAPTLTPTATATPPPILQPTWTPQVEAAQPTSPSAAVPVSTLGPTRTHTPASTLPPSTPTRTPTATPTETATPGPSPTVTNTRAPFQFTKTDSSPFYLQNFANTAGCDWMGIAGEVMNLNGQPVPSGQYRVHVWDSGVDGRVAVGGAPAYGPSGWEQFLFDQPTVRDYNVQLETVNGTPVSQVYRIQSRASCNQNLIMLNFVQNY